MEFIIKNFKDYTKETLEAFKAMILGIIVIVSIVIIKYKPAYEVTISGKTLGYITEKQSLENDINNYINSKDGCISFVEVKELPSYSLKLINRNIKTVEEKVLDSIKENAIVTYKTYAITLDGIEKFQVENQQEAEKIVSQIKEGVLQEITFDLGIIEKYSNELKIDSEETVLASLNETKQIKIDEYNKAKEEKERQEKLLKAQNAVNSQVKTYLASLGLKAPVSGSITSRYGNRSRGFHTGLDIATTIGTGFTAIASGTVTFAGDKGSYGNLIIVNHGNGIETYYAHCNSINVSIGQNIDSSTIIGTVGSTGNSTGPHLHLEIRNNGSTLNPQNYLY